jgi:hypothetical protein
MNYGEVWLKIHLAIIALDQPGIDTIAGADFGIARYRERFDFMGGIKPGGLLDDQQQKAPATFTRAFDGPLSNKHNCQPAPEKQPATLMTLQECVDAGVLPAPEGEIDSGDGAQ